MTTNDTAPGATRAEAGPSETLDAALAHIAAGRFAEAEALCEARVASDPADAQAWHLLGGIALRGGRLDAAIERCRRTLALAPALAKAHSNLGAALAARGETVEAITALQTAISLDPALVAAYANLGDAYLKIGRTAEAVAILRQGVSRDPQYAMAQLNLGAALARDGQVDEAIAVLETAVRAHPEMAQMHVNLGYSRQRNFDYQGALACYRRALELNPRMPDVLVSLGGVYHALGRLDEAVQAYDQSLALRPDYPDAAHYRSLVHLTRGNFAQGWRDHSYRAPIRFASVPLWREPLAENLSGRELFLRREQGLGDEIFFLRFAAELKRRGGRLTYQADPKIASLLRRLASLDGVVTADPQPGDMRPILSVGDLPLLLGMRTIADIPPSISLSPLPEALAAQRAALAAAGPPPYIGVTWRAGVDKARMLFKSIAIEQIGGVLAGGAGTLIALQRAPQGGEIAQLAALAGRPVHDFSALNDRLEDMLALLSLLDDYVTVSNTNVHLRAAVGRPSRVLVPWPAEYRWMSEGDRSPWFPDSPVYRQALEGSWAGALARLAGDLAVGR